MLGALAPGGPVAGWSAAAIAATVPALACVGWRRTRRALGRLRIEHSLGEHHHRGDVDVVVLPTPCLLAASNGGRRPQVLLSQGLIAALDPAELEAVVRHEIAHVRHRHDRFLLIATTVEHACIAAPPVRRSAAALRAALERWADEDAAIDVNARRDLRHALHKVTESLVAAPAAAFSDADTLLERLDALDHECPSPRVSVHVSLYAPGLLLGLMASVALGDWLSQARMVVAMAGQCLG